MRRRRSRTVYTASRQPPLLDAHAAAVLKAACRRLHKGDDGQPTCLCTSIGNPLRCCRASKKHVFSARRTIRSCVCHRTGRDGIGDFGRCSFSRETATITAPREPEPENEMVREKNAIPWAPQKIRVYVHTILNKWIYEFFT